MKKWIPYVLLVLLCGMINGCGQDEDCGLVVTGETAQISFVLQLDQQSQHRGKYEPLAQVSENIGNDFETWIRKGSLKMYIFTTPEEGLNYVGEVQHLVYVPLSNQELRFEGITSVPLQLGRTYRFMVMANCGNAATVPSGEGPEFLLADISYNQGALPLWGVCSHTVDFSAVQYLETIHLLRAVAKIEVKLTNQLREEGYRLSSVQLNRCAVKGYAFPADWKRMTFTNARESEDNYFHPYPAPPTEAVDFLPLAGDSTAYVLYLPEYDNVSGTAARISLTASAEGREEDYVEAIEFKHYQDGKAVEGTLHNIVRNQSYEFVIQEIAIGHHLSLESQVQPWVVEEESWDYTDHVSVRSEGKMQWVKGTYERIDPATGSVVMSPGTTMVCTFQIDTPEKAKWHASFIPVSGHPDAFRFETFAINGGQQATGDVGEAVSLHIRSVLPAKEQNNVARLRIVVQTLGGRTILVKNLLPDEFQDITEYTIVQPK